MDEAAGDARPVTGLHEVGRAFAGLFLDFDDAVAGEGEHEVVPVVYVRGDAAVRREYEVAHDVVFPDAALGAVDGAFFDFGRERRGVLKRQVVYGAVVFRGFAHKYFPSL